MTNDKMTGTIGQQLEEVRKLLEGHPQPSRYKRLGTLSDILFDPLRSRGAGSEDSPFDMGEMLFALACTREPIDGTITHLIKQGDIIEALRYGLDNGADVFYGPKQDGFVSNRGVFLECLARGAFDNNRHALARFLLVKAADAYQLEPRLELANFSQYPVNTDAFFKIVAYQRGLKPRQDIDASYKIGTDFLSVDPEQIEVYGVVIRKKEAENAGNVFPKLGDMAVLLEEQYEWPWVVVDRSALQEGAKLDQLISYLEANVGPLNHLSPGKDEDVNARFALLWSLRKSLFFRGEQGFVNYFGDTPGNAAWAW